MKARHDVKCSLTWTLTSLILCGLLGMACMSLAVEDTWIMKADMPTGRVGLSTSVVNGKIYAIGGGPRMHGAPLPTVEEYDPATDTWTKKADMPTAKYFHPASVVNGKIYVIGGSTNVGVATSSVEEYDPATDTWTTKADMPTARCFLSTSVVNGKIYAIGGRMYPEEVNVSTVEEYDPAMDTWTTKVNMPTIRCFLSTCIVNGKIYAIGGVAGAQATAGRPVVSIVEEYDPAMNTWTAKADMPTARKAHSSSVVDGKIYTIGGADGGKVVFPTVEEYDPATNTWTTKADMPTVRCAHSTSAVDGKIYAIGGSMVSAPDVPSSTVYEYNTGFVPEVITSVEAKGKLAAMWGEIKCSR